METLTKIQFAFTVACHILFPSFSIGLATFLVVFESLWLFTRKHIYLTISKFWIKIFALTFGMGVVSGIVMEFQLGTNWSVFSEKVGPVLGSLFIYEVLTAFFIEAGALGIMIFGWNKVNKYLHFLSTFAVFCGVMISAFWIISANSWMQSPEGVTYENGIFLVNSWRSVILNSSVFPRYWHMVTAAEMSSSMVILGISAYYLLKEKHIEFSLKCIKISLTFLFLLSCCQWYIGDKVGTNVYKNQPIKTAAIEGIWDTQQGAPVTLFAYPNSKIESNQLVLFQIPKLASLLNTHDWDGEMVGLKSVPKDARPNVPIVFYSFRLMVGIGVIMTLMSFFGVILILRKKIEKTRWFLNLCMLASPIGFIAIIFGWFTTEFGRQPWVVYNILRTDYSLSQIKLWEVIVSLSIIVLVYCVIFGFFYFKYLLQTVKKGSSNT